MKVTGAEKTTGYLAVKADEMFRLETGTTEGLERRDGRTTPVRGDFAWFRRDTFQLRLKLAVRAPEMQAVLLGYALPVDGALDVHGQLNFNILYSGVKKLRVKVPAQSADQFYFDGAQIAERNRDGDTWTIVLQKEILGAYPLKFHAVIPYDAKPANFHVDVPDLEPIDVKQQSGTWAIEADTSTEISFKTSGLNELDPLRAPVFADYQPQHHIIGVFEYLGKYSLVLEGVKHETAPILTTVADRLELDTVVATSGAERHQAEFYIRTVGDQFLDVTLPESSNLWSLTVDDQPLKPVTAKANVVRVQLPATLDRTKATRVRLLYETRRHEWRTSGGARLIAPKLNAGIPVLESKWRLFLPDGFNYSAFASNLQKTEISHARPLAFIPWSWFRRSRSMTGAPPLEFASTTYSAIPKVKQLFAEACECYNTGRYDLAYTRCVQILNLDPYNVAARRMQEKINQAKSLYEGEVYNSTRSEMVWKVEREWDRPVNKFGEKESMIIDQTKNDVQGTERIVSKLNSIIITDIEFHEATVAEVVNFLKQKCKEVDPDGQGINFVMKDGGNADARITLSFPSIPLYEAIRYITSLANLKIKIDPYAVSIVAITENTDALVTKEYYVPPGFIESASPNPGANGVTKGAAGITARAKAKDFLASQGISFPEGASAHHLPSSGKLIVRNTQANLDLMDTLVDAAVWAPPEPANGPASNGFINYGSPIQAKTAAGVLPMKLDLERSGKEFQFEGLCAPESVKFHYVDGWNLARRGWIWWVAGGVMFFAAARFSAARRLVWGLLVLTFVPLCIAHSLTGFCNALLAGWLTGLLIYLIATRLVFRRRAMEVAAP